MGENECRDAADQAEETRADESWGEVGRQFQVLGESLVTAFRTVWGSEENRQHLEGVKTGLQSLVKDVDRAIQEASDSPQAQQVRSEVERAVDSARVAGEKALQEAQPHLISALTQVNAELQAVIARMESGRTAPAAAANDGEEKSE